MTITIPKYNFVMLNKHKTMDIGEIDLTKRIIRLDTVDSTNDQAIKMLRDNNNVGSTVILADYQSGGKGQQGKQWLSEKGKNLTFSIILHPLSLTAENQFLLSMCISNGIVELLGKYSIKARIKWPNDIYTGKGKIAGILIENTLSGKRIVSSVAGIGLNVNQTLFDEKASNATSMAIEKNVENDREKILNHLLSVISSWINRLQENDLTGIKVGYLNSLIFLNEWRTYTDIKGSFEGRIIDVAGNGELLVQDRQLKQKKYFFKEIAF
jgi:BirA family transcriptional regulator, biotin operon repressor / biotin---[acetyl-CoA-carboxylase] ligase